MLEKKTQTEKLLLISRRQIIAALQRGPFRHAALHQATRGKECIIEMSIGISLIGTWRFTFYIGKEIANTNRDACTMKITEVSSRLLDRVTNWMGWIGVILILYCMTFSLTDVFLRYVMNSPSLWIGTTLQAALVLLACMAGAYAYVHGDFIKLDLFYANFSTRTKAFCDVITAVFTFMFLIVLIWKGWQSAMISIKLQQVTPTAIRIPIYPIKTIIPLSAIVMLLLVIRQFFRDLRTLFRR